MGKHTRGKASSDPAGCCDRTRNYPTLDTRQDARPAGIHLTLPQRFPSPAGAMFIPALVSPHTARSGAYVGARDRIRPGGDRLR
jgi:hypothetical protein